MKKITYLLFLFIGFFCYSNSKISLAITRNDSLKVIRKVVKNYEKGVFQNEELVVFSYENNLVSKITTTQNGRFLEDVEVKFESGKLTQMNFIYITIRNSKNDIVNPPKESLNIIYDYDNNGLIKTVRKECNALIHVVYLTYNDAKQLIKETETEGDNILSEKKFKYDKNGNLYNAKNFTAREYNYYKAYDNKKNPFSLIYPDAYLQVYKISKNNIKSCNRNGKACTYEYEYNSSNYPTKIIEKIGREVQTETIIEYRKI